MHSAMALPPSSAMLGTSSSPRPQPSLYRAISETDSYIDITAPASAVASVPASLNTGDDTSPNSRTASPLHRTRQLNRASAMQGRASPSARSQHAHMHSPKPLLASAGQAGQATIIVQSARSPAPSGRFLFSPVKLSQQQQQQQLTSAQDFAAAFGAPSSRSNSTEQEDAETEWHSSLRCSSREEDLVDRRKSTPLSFLLPTPSARATAASPFSPLLKHSLVQMSPRLKQKQMDLLSCSLVGVTDKEALLPHRESAELQGKMQRNCSAPEYPNLYEEEHARQQQQEQQQIDPSAVAPAACSSYILPPVAPGSPRRVLPSTSTHASPLLLSRPASTMHMGFSPTPFTPRRLEASPSLVVRQALRLTPQPFNLGSSAVSSAAVGEGGFVLPPAPRGLLVDSNGSNSGSSFQSEPVPFRRIPFDSAVASAVNPHPQSMPQRVGSLFRSSPLRDARPSRFLQQQQQAQQQSQQHPLQQEHRPSSAVSSISSLYDYSTEPNIVAPLSSSHQTTEAFVPTLPSYLRSDNSDGSISNGSGQDPAAASIVLPSASSVASLRSPAPASILFPFHSLSSTLPRALSSEEVLEEPFAPLPLEMQRQDVRNGSSISNNSSSNGGEECSSNSRHQQEGATGGSSSISGGGGDPSSQALYSHSGHSSSGGGHSSRSQHTHSSSSSSQHHHQQHSGHSHHSFNSSHSSSHCSGPLSASAANSAPDLTSAESFFSRPLSSPMWPNVLLQSLSPTLSQFLATPLGQARLLAKLRGGAVLRQHGLNLRNIMHHEFEAREGSSAAAAAAVTDVAATAVAPALSSRASLPLPALSEEIEDESASARSLDGALRVAAPISLPVVEAVDEYSAAIGSAAASAVSYRFIWLRGEGSGMEVCWARLRDRAFAGGSTGAVAPMPTPMGSFPVSWLSGVCTGADSPTFSFCRVHALASNNAHTSTGGSGADTLTTDPRRCLSLLLNSGDSLDLECTSQEETDSWMRAFVFLHRHALKEEHMAAQGMGSRAASLASGLSAAGADESAQSSAAASALSSPLPPAFALPAAPSMSALTSSAVGASHGNGNGGTSHSRGSHSTSHSNYSQGSHQSNQSCRSESAAMALSQLAAVVSNGSKPATQASATAAVSASPSPSGVSAGAILPAFPVLLPASSSLGARMCTSSNAIGIARASTAYRQQSQPEMHAAARGRVVSAAPAVATASSSAAQQGQAGSQFSDDEFALLCAAVMLQMGPDGSDSGRSLSAAASASSVAGPESEDCTASFRALDSSSYLDADSMLLAELVNPAAWSTPLAAANARHTHAHRQACISIVHRLTSAQRMLGLYQRDHARLSSRLSAELAQKRRQLAQLQQQSAVYRSLLEQSKAVNAEWHRRMPEVAAAAAAGVVLPQAQQRSWVISAPAVCSSRTVVASTDQAEGSSEHRESGSVQPELVPSPALAAPSNLAVLFPPLRASQLHVSVLTPATVAASAAASARAPKHLNHHSHLLPAQPPSSHSSTDSSGSASSSSDASARRMLLPMLSDSSATGSGSGSGSARSLSSGTLGRRTLVSMDSDGTPTAFRHSSRSSNNNGGADSARSNSTATSDQDSVSQCSGSSGLSDKRSTSAEEPELQRNTPPRATSGGSNSNGSGNGSGSEDTEGCDGDRSSSDSTSGSSPASRLRAAASASDSGSGLIVELPSAVASKHQHPPQQSVLLSPSAADPAPFGSAGFVLQLPPAQTLREIPREDTEL